MDEERARELIARRRELTTKIGELLDDYVDVLQVPGMVANDWRRITTDGTADDEDRSMIAMRLGECRPEVWDTHIIRGWVLAAELAPFVTDDQGSTRGYLSPPEQLPAHSRGIYGAALNG